MRWRRPDRAHALGLHLSVHADTDQEFTDHTLRFGWIGPIDPHPLDVGFFTPPGPGYGGPALHARRSTAATLYSMGDPWPRDPATGAIRAAAATYPPLFPFLSFFTFMPLPYLPGAGICLVSACRLLISARNPMM